jgi:hypothetical protein
MIPAYTLLLDGELPTSDFLGAFSVAEGRVKSITNYAFGDTRITQYLVQYHQMGIAFDPGLSVLVATDGIKQRIDIASIGTFETFLSGDAPTMEAEDLSNDLYIDLFHRARRAGMKVQEIGRVPLNLGYRDPEPGAPASAGSG